MPLRPKAEIDEEESRSLFSAILCLLLRCLHFSGLCLDLRWWYLVSLDTEMHVHSFSPINGEDEVLLLASSPYLKIVPLLVYGPFHFF